MINKIADHLDIFVDKGLTELLDKHGISAFIELESKIVEFNDKHPVVRKRFSVAHEIGHLILGHSIKNDIFSYSTKDATEVEANIFASELLMPYDWLKRDLKESGVNIENLSKKYWVSKEALGWRLANSDGLLLG